MESKVADGAFQASKSVSWSASEAIPHSTAANSSTVSVHWVHRSS